GKAVKHGTVAVTQVSPANQTPLSFESAADEGGVAHLSGLDPRSGGEITCIAAAFSRAVVRFAAPPREARCQLDPLGSIHGVVRDADTAEPIRDATVSLRPNGGSVHTDKTGAFALRSIVPRAYRVRATAPGRKVGDKDATATSPE